ncbi:hypothetical protein OG216_44120 [Streptomycetaceae bacterium NBC_01309]
MRAAVWVGHRRGWPLVLGATVASLYGAVLMVAGDPLPLSWLVALLVLMLAVGGCAWAHWARPCRDCGAPNSSARWGP